MAFAIPKIQYNNTDTMGDTTSGSGTITNVADTSQLLQGMFCRGAGIPVGAIVDTFDSNSVTLAGGVLATISDSAVVLAFGFEINFEYSPKEQNGEVVTTNATTTDSLSGVRQVAVNYIGAVRSPIFSFLSPALYTLLSTFLNTWALTGKTFRYYDDQTLTSYVSYELDSLKVTPTKLHPRGVDLYSWEVPLNFRRVL